VARLVVFDMDGVLADTESSWVYVHRHFGVSNDHSLYAYLRGEIDDLEFIRRDIGLWRQKEPEITAKMIGKILDAVPLMPGAKKAISGLREKGYRTAIVSAGIDLLSERIARELEIDAQLANGFVLDKDGRLSGEGVLRVCLMDKGDAVEETGRSMGASRKDIVTVGNSQYDISMFERSGLGIAFHPSDSKVREKADVVVEVKDLSEIVKVIDNRVRL
jgi:phosphoserine phosphatase